MKKMYFLATAICWSLLSPTANAAVIAVVDTGNTANDTDAWSIFNDTGFGITQIVLQGTDPVDLDPIGLFEVDASSDSVGVTQSGSNPASGNNFFTVTLDFLDFDAGESFIFGLDTDGHGFSADGLAGLLDISVSFANGSTGSDTFQLVGASNPDAVSASIAVPGPAGLGLLGFGLLGLAFARRA
ncbi:MAG: hypothetical protein AB8B93_06100 [Pseudomonadales bacterium]